MAVSGVAATRRRKGPGNQSHQRRWRAKNRTGHLRSIAMTIFSPDSELRPTRRALLLSAAAFAAVTTLPGFAFAAEAPVKGGTLTADIGTEPPVLVNFAHTAGAGVYVSAKTTEGLLTYDFDLNP